MTAYDEYFSHKMENLQPPIQMQLSKKQKAFCGVSIKFLNCSLSFEHFEKKELHSNELVLMNNNMSHLDILQRKRLKNVSHKKNFS